MVATEMIFLQIFLSIVGFFTAIALFMVALNKLTGWVSKKFGGNVAFVFHSIIYFSFFITLICFLLGMSN